MENASMASKNFTEMPTQCPECNGGVWDETKGRGKRSPKAPDCRCKDKDNCGWAGWYAEGAKPQRGANGGQRQPQQYAWAKLLKLSVQYVQKEITPLFGGKCTPEMEKEMATTLFIAASKERGDIFAKATAETPAEALPLPRPIPPPRRAEYDDTSDDLPF